MRRYLFTPGPVELSEKVKRALTIDMVSHRSREFSSLMERLQSKLKALMDTDGPVLLFPGSGTFALEALIVNLISEGDKVLSFSCGHFGERFREIASRLGANIVSIDKPYGEVFTRDDVTVALEDHKDVTAILITHNETSTGAVNPIEDITKCIPENGPLVLVDAVSSLGVMPCFPRKWRVDGIASCSQKGLMVPPGIGIAWLSDRAWKRVYERRTCPSYSMDFTMMRTYLEKELPQTPATPPVSLFFALDASLAEVEAEGGFEKRFQERQLYARALCSAVKECGLELLVKEEYARSPGVTAICIPDKADAVRSNLRKRGIEIAGGQGSLKNKIIRVGHYTRESISELRYFIQALREASQEAGIVLKETNLDKIDNIFAGGCI